MKLVENKEFALELINEVTNHFYEHGEIFLEHVSYLEIAVDMLKTKRLAIWK